MDHQWHYVRDGKSLGPISISELRRLVAQGELRSDDLVWREGMAEWSSVAALRLAPPAVAPPPVPVAPPTNSRYETRNRPTRAPVSRPVVLWSSVAAVALLMCVGWAFMSLTHTQRRPGLASNVNDRAEDVAGARDRLENKRKVAQVPPPLDEPRLADLDSIAVETTSESAELSKPEEMDLATPSVVSSKPSTTSSEPQPSTSRQPASNPPAKQTLFQVVDIQRRPSFSIQGFETKQSLHYQVLSQLDVDRSDESRTTKVVQSVQDTRLVAADEMSRESFRQALDNLKRQQYTYRLNHRGEVIEFTGHKDTRVTTPLELAASTGFQLTSVIDEDGWKELAELTFVVPPEAQQAGEPWKRQMTHDWGELGSWSGITTFSPQPPKEQLAQITFAREMNYAAPRSSTGGLPFQIRHAAFELLQAAGTIEFDVAAQRVRRATENFDVRGTVTADLAGVGVQIELTEQQHIEISVSIKRPAFQ